MEFLLLFFGYVILFGVCALLVLFSSASPLLSNVIEKIKDLFIKVVHSVIPQFIIQFVNRTLHYVFNTRNHVMQFVFGLLVLGGNIILMLDILPILYIFEPDDNHILLPLLLLFSNLAAFHLSCSTDPGRITSSSDATILASLYKADGLLFKDKVDCPTCQFVKPARSKHCSICNCCVHRFDHHCIWTNNCVGGGNLRYFLPFLLSLMMMIINGMIVGLRALMLLVHHFKMMESSYVDNNTGKILPVTFPVLIQHLFMQHPRIVFLVSSLMMLTILLGLFTLYHLFLLWNNQTTNERYKVSKVQNDRPVPSVPAVQGKKVGSGFENVHCPDQPLKATNGKHSQDYTGSAPVKLNGNGKVTESNGKQSSHSVVDRNNSTVQNGNKKSPGKGGTCGKYIERKIDMNNFYDRGLLLNLKEVFFPWSDFHILKKKVSESNSKFGAKNSFLTSGRKIKKR